MKVKDGKIVQATEQELFDYYLRNGYDDLFPFGLYKRRCVELGTEVIESEE